MRWCNGDDEGGESWRRFRAILVQEQGKAVQMGKRGGSCGLFITA